MTDPYITSTNGLSYKATYKYTASAGATAVTGTSSSTISTPTATKGAEVLTALGSIGLALLALSF